MKTIILISCCKTKLSHKAPAEQLYQSAGFKKQFTYAKSLNPDHIFVISAKHHLVSLTHELEPYDVCLNDKSSAEIKDWSKIVLNQLSEVSDLENDRYVILAGKTYYKELIKGMHNYELPLEGLQLGTRLQWLDKHTDPDSSETECMKIHKWASTLPRLNWTFDESDIPANGVYLFFENGEKYCGYDRIIRVGTHTGDNNLAKRIEEHLVKENKDRSIFRKNIGRAILNKRNDSFLEKWNWDRTTPENRSKHNWTSDDDLKLCNVEKEVSCYMRNNLSFVCIPIDSKEERLSYESYLIKTLSSDPAFKPSKEWLGYYSPVEKIRRSGLWLVNELSSDKKCPVKNKYLIFTEYLKSQEVDVLTITFRQIEQIMAPENLPISAYKYRAWWSNTGHSHSSIWQSAGYKVLSVTSESVTFKHI